MKYEIKRNTTIVATVHAVGSQQREVMGKDIVNMDFSLSSYVEFLLGDTVEVYSKSYILNKRPQIEKVSSAQYNYTLQFEAEGYDLNKEIFFLLDDSNLPISSDFPLTLDASGFVDAIVSNMNRNGTGWTKGTVDVTDVRTISFAQDNCRAALSKVAQEYDIEFWIDGKEINVTKQGQLTTLEFQYGKGKGLYSITKSVSEDKDVFSRLYVYGSEKNIPASYGKRLHLPSGNYIEEAATVAKYGVIEKVQIYDDIYPHRTGTISGVTDAFTFTDASMDFDVNAQLISGVTAKVVFKSGDLAGQEFVINNYDNGTKTFKINTNDDDKNNVVPNANFKPAIGDKYTIVDIEMPQTYIDAAETDLQTAGQDYYDKNANGRELYAVDCDPLYFKNQGIGTLNLGYFVTIKDTPMGVDSSIRIISIERDLQTEYKYNLTLADTATVASIVREYFEDQRTQIIIQQNNLNDVARARRNWRNTADLEDMVFDPEGDYYTDKIKPGSIETLYLAAGAKAQNYSLNGVIIKPNFQADANELQITAGQLVHYTLEIESLGSIWAMSSSDFDNLNPNKSYYLFAKISKTALTGTWELLESPVEIDNTTGYYTIGVGVLFSVEDGYRNFEFNKGMTYIVGDTIKTGRIQSMDAQNYFDLTHGKFNLGNATSGLDWDVTKDDTLTIRGGIAVNPGGNEEPIGVFRGEYNSTATYYEGDTVTFQGSTYKVISDTPITNSEPSETNSDYKLLAAKGETGSGGILRVIYKKNSDPDNAPSLNVNNSNPTSWSQQMPQIDTSWILSTDEGDYIVNQDGDEYLTTVDGEYIWAATEVLDQNNNFDHWSAPTRITGRNGIPNEYTEYRFQINGSSVNAPAVDKTDSEPQGWTIVMPQPGDLEYLWMIKANKLPNGTLVSAWSDPVRTNGVDGAAANKGDPGPFMQFRGEWNKEGACGDTRHKQYVGNAQHIDVVKYNGDYYVARTDAGDIPIDTLPTDTDYWNTFAGEFESVATGLLFAELAYINNLGVRFLRTKDDGQRIELTGQDECSQTPTPNANTLIFYDNNNNEVLKLDGKADYYAFGESKVGIRMSNPVKNRVSYITANGVFSNAGGVDFIPATSGIDTNATVVGLLFDRNSDNNGISAAVAGIDSTSSGNSESWGGYFNSLKVTGEVEMDKLQLSGSVNNKVTVVTDNYYIKNDDYIISCYNTSNKNVFFPSSPQVGRTIIIRQNNSARVYLKGNGNDFLSHDSSGDQYDMRDRGLGLLVVWDGSYWLTMRMHD